MDANANKVSAKFSICWPLLGAEKWFDANEVNDRPDSPIMFNLPRVIFKVDSLMNGSSVAHFHHLAASYSFPLLWRIHP